MSLVIAIVDPVKNYLMFFGLMSLLLGCGVPPESSSSTVTTDPSTSATASPSSGQAVPAPSSAAPAPETAPQSTVISAEGIGAARLGMTLGELKQQLGSGAEFTVQSPFIVDFDAIAVRQNGAVQYYILYLAGQPLTDSDPIQGVLTDNPDYKTAAEVGAGTPLTQAEAAYGKATFAYNTENESREYVRFERQSATNISFATGNGSQDPAGIYPAPTSTYNETQEYRQDAKIQSVLVVCLAEDCAGSP